MVALRLTLFASLACVLGCALGPESREDVPYEPDDRFADPPDVGRRFDAGAVDASARGATSRRDAGARLPIDGVAQDGWDAGDELPEPALSSQAEVDDAGFGREAAVDASAVVAEPVGPPAVCRPGTYAGVFAGELRALLGIARVEISGALRFALPTAGGGKLALQSGLLSGRDSEGNPINATISGTLNCVTGQIEGGRLTGGTYTRPDPVLRGRTTTAQFTGVTVGTFSDDPPSAKGSWALDPDRSARSGSGTWSVSLMP